MDMNKEITDFEKHAQKFFNTDKAFEKKDNQYIYDEVVMMWDCWIKQAKSKQTEIDELKEKLEETQVPEGFVLVPKECPDPIFADKLFDLLCKKAHGEFGDDQMIFFSDINESEIWEKMIEAAQGEGHE